MTTNLCRDVRAQLAAEKERQRRHKQMGGGSDCEILQLRLQLIVLKEKIDLF